METESKSRTATRVAVLDSAERLFASRGFNATSVRAITDDARANLGAINYHFESKDALILEVLRRRLQPLNAQRIALLDQFETEAKGRPVEIEKILEALFRPPTELFGRGTKGGRSFIKLMAQCLTEPAEFLQPLIKQEFAEKNRRFHAAIHRALPYLDSDEVHWRLHFATGVFLHTIAYAQVLELSSSRRCRVRDVEETLARMIRFCAAGFVARDGNKSKGRK